MITLAAWLDQVQAQGVKLGLDRVRSALALLDDPQRSFPSILIGGTNGKGSTVTFASGLLRAAGWTVGATTSPHLIEYRERFRIDGKLPDVAELEAVAVAAHARLVGRPGMDQLTFFELGILLATSLFAREEVDAAVIEVGMGGELDATRAAESIVAGIVTIDLDHEKYLGTTIEAIARTKARIAPPGGVLVTTEVRPDRLAILEEEAAAAGSELRASGRDFEWAYRDSAIDYRGPLWALDAVPVGMAGEHQGINAACALAAVEAFCDRTGLRAPDPWQVATALREAKIPGRLERLRVPGAPAFLCDGAHNPAGAEALAAALTQRRRPPRRVWLVASMQEKERGPMIESLLPHVDEVVCTRGQSSPRFEDPHGLVEEFTAHGAKARAVASAAEAVADLSRTLGMRDEVLVAGSLYLIGDVRAALGFPVT